MNYEKTNTSKPLTMLNRDGGELFLSHGIPSVYCLRWHTIVRLTGSERPLTSEAKGSAHGVRLVSGKGGPFVICTCQSQCHS